MKTDLFHDSRGLIDDQTLAASTVRCFHLGQHDLLNIGDRMGGVIYEMDGGKPVLITRGEVLTSGARHILIFREENVVGGGFNRDVPKWQDQPVEPRMIDYLEVFSS